MYTYTDRKTWRMFKKASFLNLPFDAPYWLSMEINTDGEMSPRQAITSVGYAYRAEVADSVSGGTAIPQGAIILWPDLYGDGSCPVGYTRVTALDGKFIVGGATYNAAAGGNNTHTHGGPNHTHSYSGTTSTKGADGLAGSVDAYIQYTGPHVHSFSGNTDSSGTSDTGSADSRPEFATVILCEKN